MFSYKGVQMGTGRQESEFEANMQIMEDDQDDIATSITGFRKDSHSRVQLRTPEK